LGIDRKLLKHLLFPMNIDQIRDYVKKLVEAYPDIKSIWLFGTRANNLHRSDSDWDLFVFGNQRILDSLKENNSFNNDHIDLMVVFNNAEFEKPWPDEKGVKHGSLKSWEWHEISSKDATYKSVKCINEDEWFKQGMLDCKTLKAFKIWPENL
jgi:predicted nucleotidyltransferase